ncbi:MAG: Uma2 family endonuclease [Isosphaeraceae bacterium]
MATVETETRVAPGESRVVIRDVGWQGYETLLNLVGDQPVRITYDRGDVELMSPLLKHERNRSLLGLLVRILTAELRIPRMSAGATTLKREDLDRGLEADESFYFWDLSRISDPDNLNLEVDPPPDLAIEIEITRSVLNRLGIYGALRVAEIWRFNGSTVRILLLRQDGSYEESSVSKALPWITLEEIQRFVAQEASLDESQWIRSFRRWVRETVLPRFRAERGGE